MNLLKWNDEMKLGRPFILDFAQSLLPGSANVYQKHGVSTRSLEGFRVVVDWFEEKTPFLTPHYKFGDIFQGYVLIG